MGIWDPALRRISAGRTYFDRPRMKLNRVECRAAARNPKKKFVSFVPSGRAPAERSRPESEETARPAKRPYRSAEILAVQASLSHPNAIFNLYFFASSV